MGFAGQAALSLGLSAWVFFLTSHGNMDITRPEGSRERAIERKRLEFVSSILMVGSDIQSTLGIAYMVTVFSQVHSMKFIPHPQCQRCESHQTSNALHRTKS